MLTTLCLICSLNQIGRSIDSTSARTCELGDIKPPDESSRQSSIAITIFNAKSVKYWLVGDTITTT